LPATIRLAALACVSSAVALLAPAESFAARLYTESATSLVYEGEAGEANTLAIGQSSTEFSFSDAGSERINTSGDCRPLLMTASCTLPSVETVTVDVADGHDRVSAGIAVASKLLGGPGDDTLVGGSGADTFLGGDGNDVVASRDGVPESVDCGPGQDTVDADPSDTVTGCEVGGPAGEGEESPAPPPLELPPLPEPEAPPGRPAEPAPQADAPAGEENVRPGDEENGPQGGEETAPPGGAAPNRDLVLAPTPLDMLSADVAVVHMGCAPTAAEDCAGEVILELAGGAGARRRGAAMSRARHKARQRRIGRSRFRIEPGKSLDVRVRINERGHAILRSKRRQRGRLRIVHRDGAGQVTGVTTRSVVFTARKWGRRKARPRRR
jgi:RTX calcium-binding nonapeptide repeat (4 copies)